MKVRTRVTVLVGVVMAALLPLSTTAAAVTAPPDPNVVGFATISDLSINGVPGTTAVVAPGSAVSITATVADSHPGYCPGCIDNVPIGLEGAAEPAGCLFEGGFHGQTQTNTVTLTAPTEPGYHNVVAEANFSYWCSQLWDGAGTTIAVLLVTGDSGQLCGLAQSWSTDPEVAAGLCDKLTAAQAAYDRGNANVVANLLGAFESQLSAQSGKALTTEQAATLALLATYLF